MKWRLVLAGLAALALRGEETLTLSERARQYLVDLVRLNTSNPPGNESRVAEYLKQVADANGIPAELLGPDPKRMNFVARLKGTGRARPLLLMAHSDVVPADRSQWTADPFGGEIKDGFVYGRGAQDSKGLLAAELAALVEIKKRAIKLNRDIILLAEADQEGGASGIQWLLQNVPAKVDAEFAINEGGMVLALKDGTHVWQVQTAEKIPARIALSVRAAAAVPPRGDNPILRLAQALVRLADAEQPLRFNAATRRYFRDLSRLDDYSWLAPLLPRLDNPATMAAAASQVKNRDPELESALHATVVPVMFRGGQRAGAPSNRAEAMIDVFRLPSETREDILARVQKIVNDLSIEANLVPGAPFPAMEPTGIVTAVYKAVERAVGKLNQGDAVVPYMSRTATDSAFLRARGVAVYGVPLFAYDGNDVRPHGIDERIAVKSIETGTELLWQVVLEVAAAGS